MFWGSPIKTERSSEPNSQDYFFFFFSIISFNPIHTLRLLSRQDEGKKCWLQMKTRPNKTWYKVPMLKSRLYNIIGMKKGVWGNELVYHKVSFSALTNEENHQHFRICSEGRLWSRVPRLRMRETCAFNLPASKCPVATTAKSRKT